MTSHVHRHRRTRRPGHPTRAGHPTHSSRRRGILIAVAMLAAAALVPLEFARQALVGRLINATGTLTDGAPLALALAGWLTFGLLPLLAVVLDRDNRNRYG